MVFWCQQVGAAGRHHWQQHTRTLGGALGRAATTAVGATATAGGVDRSHLRFEFCRGCAWDDRGARCLRAIQDRLQTGVDTQLKKVRAGRSERI